MDMAIDLVALHEVTGPSFDGHEHVDPIDCEPLAQVLGGVLEELRLSDLWCRRRLGDRLVRIGFGSGSDSGADEAMSLMWDWLLRIMAYTDKGRALRPARLNYAGYCDWCLGRWCTSSVCIQKYERSVWQVCELCDGRGMDAVTSMSCGCGIGLVQQWRPRD